MFDYNADRRPDIFFTNGAALPSMEKTAATWPPRRGSPRRWIFRWPRESSSRLQPDVTAVGSVGEWQKVAHMAAALDVSIAPHYNWDLHTQLVATIPNGLFIEYFVRGADVKVFDELLENPFYPRNGYISPRTDPSFGLQSRDDQISRYRVA